MQQLFILTLFSFIALFTFCPSVRKIFIKKYPNKIVPLSEEEFFQQFEAKMPENSKKNRKENNERWKELIEKAWKARDFEIELYWKRANYFWLFQVPAFAAYFAINKTIDDISKTNQKPDEVFVIICIGIVFSTAWLLINKGSKSWQRHWEMYIDLLERKYYGPFYQTVGSDRTYSVSKINEIVSASFIVVWIIFAINFIGDREILSHLTFKISDLNSTIAFAIFFTILALISMLFGYGRGYFKDREILMYRRKHHYSGNVWNNK